MFNASDISQLTNASKTLRDEILEILSAASEPMTCGDIMQVSKLCPDRETMTREVYAMKNSGLVEPAGETARPGSKPVWLYRLPDAGVNHSQNSLQENVEEEQQVNTEQSAKDPKERPRVTSQDIRDMVILHPGIKREDVYKKLVFTDGSNKKKVGDLISCLIGTKQITQTDENGLRRLHVGPQLNKVIAGKKPVTPKEKGKTEARVKVPAGKLLMGDEARPLQQFSFNAGSDDHISNNEKSTVQVQPAGLVAAQPKGGAITLQNHLSAVAAALPPGIVLGVCLGIDGKIEFTLDTNSGAAFNFGENIDGVVIGINALAALQPFAENL